MRRQRPCASDPPSAYAPRVTRVYELVPEKVEEQSARAAGWLAAKGLRAGDRVAMRTPNYPRLLALAHGALRTGIVPVFVGPTLHEPERAWIVRDSRPSLVVDDLDRIPWHDTPAAEI